MKKIIVVLLVLFLVLSLGACSKDKKAEAEDPAAGAKAEEPEKPTAEEEPAEPESGQDLSGFPSFKDWTPMFPEHESSIVWNPVPKDYVGGFGSQATPKADNTGYVNVRKTPSIEADVIDKLQHEKDSDITWGLVMETYVKDGQLFVGEYQVKNGDYTWTAVASYDPNSSKSTTGWVALEVVDLHGI